jgi:predicted N-acetyltransferase YhbS
MKLRPLTADDAEQAWNLSLLAFGGDPEAPPQPGPPGPAVGAFDERGRLLAAARARPYHQWWCGLPVPMAGIAGVAVHPDARGQGLVGRLMDALVGSAEQPVSALFPTAPRIYRRLGWEVVGRLDHTVVPVSSLPRAAQVPLRGATPGDLTALTALYDERGRAGSGLLTRTGPSFAKGPAGLLEHQVVTLAVEDGIVVGYLAYDGAARPCASGSA